MPPSPGQSALGQPALASQPSIPQGQPHHWPQEKPLDHYQAWRLLHYSPQPLNTHCIQQETA